MRKKTIEDYAEIIYILEEEKGMVHTNDIASALDINPASVTEIFQKLNDEGYMTDPSQWDHDVAKELAKEDN